MTLCPSIIGFVCGARRRVYVPVDQSSRPEPSRCSDSDVARGREPLESKCEYVIAIFFFGIRLPPYQNHLAFVIRTTIAFDCVPPPLFLRTPFDLLKE
jgi:hypothetical protein